MAADPNPALRAQLIADRASLAPQIRGLPDVANTSVSADMVAALNQQLHVRVRRRDLIQAVLDQLDQTVTSLVALEADGWPDAVPHAVLSQSLFDELHGEQSDVESAVAVFVDQQAASIKVTLGDPIPKT